MQRPLVLVAAWLVAAAAAVGVGFLAVSLISASAAPPPQPGRPAASSTTEAAGPPASAAGEQSTAGGTVYASCVDGTAQLAGAPATGWTVESAPGQVEFRDGTQQIEVRADCSTGSPRFAVEGPTAEGGATVPAPTTSSSSPGVDDHGGNRGGGGHGSDD